MTIHPARAVQKDLAPHPRIRNIIDAEKAQHAIERQRDDATGEHFAQAEALADVDSLYAYMSKRLVEANVQNDPEILNEVARLLITVKEGWDAIGDQAADS